MYILGISVSHNSTAALLKDNKIIACASEERFNRIKNYTGVPKKSIRYCLSQTKIDISKLDKVMVAGTCSPPLIYIDQEKIENFGVQAPSLSTKLYQKARQAYLFSRENLEYTYPFFKGTIDQLYNFGFLLLSKRFQSENHQRINELYKIPKEKIQFVDHHLCHAYAALYSSPFPKTNKPILVFTSDCQGDNLSATVNIYKNGELKRVSATSMHSSLGALYTEVTKFLGMQPNNHEYKVMGLAPYAPQKSAEESYKLLKELIWLDKKNLVFNSKISSESFKIFLSRKLQNKRFDHIAAAIQQLTEELLTEWVQTAIKRYKIPTIACGGGVFMNIKANKRVLKIPELKKLFVMPSCGDESNAIGAAFAGYIQNRNTPKSPPLPLNNLYLGPSFTNEEVKKTLNNKQFKGKYKIKYYKNIEEITSSLLSQGKILARFADSMEWGARALGNRSILADSSRYEVVDKINRMIKKRDFWMPFAPLILDTWENKYLVNPKKAKSPYMTLGFDSTQLAKAHLKAAIHPYDKTLRPQVIDKQDNPQLYKILNLFSKKTNMGGLLNTSFNIHGEPIVCTPNDAMTTFSKSGLKYMSLNNYLISKPE